jgi:PAS domain S-box-containing protein
MSQAFDKKCHIWDGWSQKQTSRCAVSVAGEVCPVELQEEVDVRTDELLAMNARAELTFVTDHAAVMLAHCDRQMRYIFVNRSYASHLQVNPDSILGKRIPEVIGEQAFRAIEPYIQRALAGERVEFEIEVPYGSQQTRFMHCVYVPDRDELSGETHGIVAALSDITDRRRLEEQLREADRRKDEFLAVLSHELRNPLAPIRNAVHFLKTRGTADVSARSAYEIIERQTRHLTRLVDDLMEIARITDGRIQLQQEPVSLALAVTNAVDACRPMIDEARQRLTVQIEDQSLSVTGDIVRLSQVVTNLLNNASKYTPSQGHIEVRLYREGSHGVIRVADTGAGIPADMSARIFDMFVQLDPHAPRAKGLGVGLALTKRLTELHGGTIEVHSEGKDRGSTFRVRFPLLANGVADQASHTRAHAEPLPESILVADDNPDVVESLRMILAALGSSVHVAHDGAEAIDMAQQSLPQAAILDIGMPHVDGYDAARRIRTLAGGETCLLIALTGWGQAEDRRRAREAGFDIHLTKPVDPNQLLAALSRYRRPAGASA